MRIRCIINREKWQKNLNEDDTNELSKRKWKFIDLIFVRKGRTSELNLRL